MVANTHHFGTLAVAAIVIVVADSKTGQRLFARVAGVGAETDDAHAAQNQAGEGAEVRTGKWAVAAAVDGSSLEVVVGLDALMES